MSKTKQEVDFFECPSKGLDSAGAQDFSRVVHSDMTSTTNVILLDTMMRSCSFAWFLVGYDVGLVETWKQRKYCWLFKNASRPDN